MRTAPAFYGCYRTRNREDAVPSFAKEGTAVSRHYVVERDL